MNSLQEKAFQILKSVIEICNELKLRYYLVCGSALGAVKYNGFIPWDDDVDIGIVREDYEKFCREASKMLPEYYFLQNYKTDKNYPALYSKVRDSRTTYIETSVSNLDINHGVYIDVFPLDGYPTNKCEAKVFELKKRVLKYGLFCVFDQTHEVSWKAKMLHKVGRMIGLNRKTNILVGKLSELISKYPIEESNLICNHGNWQGKLEYAPKEQYGTGVIKKFEGLDVRVPEKYHDYLSQKYGDWESDLPVEEQVGHHYYSVCDLSKSYTEYMKK